METTTAAQQQSGSSSSGMPAAQQQSGSNPAAQQQSGSMAAEQQIPSGCGYLVSEAAELLEIPERTLRAWIRQGKVPVLAPTEGSRGVRLSERTLQEMRHVKPVTWDGERFLRQSGGNPAGSPPEADEQQPDSGNAAAERQSGGNPAERQEEAAALPAARFYEDLLAGVERERDQALREVGHLRAQLDQRAEEAQRHAIAEEQLRVMLMKLEATNAQMTGALVQKALPPAPEPEAARRRLRWWALWSRR
jgi:excisionase family DNA binding protein